MLSENKNSLLHKKTPRDGSFVDSTRFRIMEPYRSLGLITSSLAPQYSKRNQDRFLLTSNGKSFLLYNLEKLRLERISPPMQGGITALAFYKNKIFTAMNGKVQLWEKIHIIKEYGDENESEITKIMTFDDVLLFSNKNGDLYAYRIYTGELIAKMNLRINIMIHPTTYFNRVLFSKIPEQYEQDLQLKNYEADLILFNVNSQKEIYNFRTEGIFPKQATITAIEQSPVVDIVALAFSNGDVILFNIKTSKKVLSLSSVTAITSITFSSSLSFTKSLLCTVSNKAVTIWDLNTKKIHYTLSIPHSQHAMFIPNEPLLAITSEENNSIEIFKFDANSAIPSLLKHRRGHHFSPCKIRFYGESANNECNHIISIDKQSLRNISVINEHMSKEFSMKKLADSIFSTPNRNIFAFAYNEFRERDWANIAILLSNYPKPLLFSSDTSSLTPSQPYLKTKNSQPTSIEISMCGNFGFVGFENGTIECFNMQSGNSRWVFSNAHNSAITSIKTDGLNSMLVSISEKENEVKFFEILQRKLIFAVNLPSAPCQIELNRDNDLVGVSLVNGNIVVIDKSQGKIVREFQVSQKNQRIRDFCFSKDATWLIVAYSNTVKIFNVISGNLIEWVQFDKTVSSVTISPNSQYIALSFDNDKGIYLYVNRTMFIDIDDVEKVDNPIYCEIAVFDAKRIKSRKEFALSTKEEKEEEKENDNNELQCKLCDENKNLISLSNENALKYRIVNNIEIIQEKNAAKPNENSKEKSEAPFFLFNIDDVINARLPSKTDSLLSLLKKSSNYKSQKKAPDLPKENLNLKQILIKYHNKSINASDITNYLNNLSPMLIDVEIRSLDPLINIDKEDYLSIFIDYLIAESEKEFSNFEMIQAYFNRFIKIYTNDIISNKSYKERLATLSKTIDNKFTKINDLYRGTTCLISFFGKIQI